MSNGITLREKTKRFVRSCLPTREQKEKRAELDREAVELAERLEKVVESPDYKCSLLKILDEVRQELFSEIVDRETKDDRFAKGGVAALDRINEKIGVARTKGTTALLRLKALEETENARAKKTG